MARHHLLGICGSLRENSVNRRLLAEAMRIYDPASSVLADLRLPLYDGDLETAEGIPAPVQTLSDQIASADAVIIASPEYNKSITGVLKNALDWVSRTRGGPWAGRPVAVMSAAAGRTGGEAGQVALRNALAPFRPRLVLGPALMVADGASQFGADGRLTNERYATTLADFMAALRAEVDRDR